MLHRCCDIDDSAISLTAVLSPLLSSPVAFRMEISRITVSRAGYIDFSESLWFLSMCQSVAEVQSLYVHGSGGCDLGFGILAVWVGGGWRHVD